MSEEPMHAVMMALLTATAGCMLAMAAGMARASRPLVSWTGVTFDLAAVAYAIKLWNNQSHILPIWLSAPVIAVSADACAAHVQAGLQAGFARYLTKPYKLTDLLEAIDCSLRDSQRTVGAC